MTEFFYQPDDDPEAYAHHADVEEAAATILFEAFDHAVYNVSGTDEKGLPRTLSAGETIKFTQKHESTCEHTGSIEKLPDNGYRYRISLALHPDMDNPPQKLIFILDAHPNGFDAYMLEHRNGRTDSEEYYHAIEFDSLEDVSWFAENWIVGLIEPDNNGDF